MATAWPSRAALTRCTVHPEQSLILGTARRDNTGARTITGRTIAQLSARLRCAECGGPLHSVKPWRVEDVIGKPLGLIAASAWNIASSCSVFLMPAKIWDGRREITGRGSSADASKKRPNGDGQRPISVKPRRLQDVLGKPLGRCG